jgi:hypothetical protein
MHCLLQNQLLRAHLQKFFRSAAANLDQILCSNTYTQVLFYNSTPTSPQTLSLKYFALMPLPVAGFGYPLFHFIAMYLQVQ